MLIKYKILYLEKQPLKSLKQETIIFKHFSGAYFNNWYRSRFARNQITQISCLRVTTSPAIARKNNWRWSSRCVAADILNARSMIWRVDDTASCLITVSRLNFRNSKGTRKSIFHWFERGFEGGVRRNKKKQNDSPFFCVYFPKLSFRCELVADEWRFFLLRVSTRNRLRPSAASLMCKCKRHFFFFFRLPCTTTSCRPVAVFPQKMIFFLHFLYLSSKAAASSLNPPWLNAP